MQYVDFTETCADIAEDGVIISVSLQGDGQRTFSTDGMQKFNAAESHFHVWIPDSAGLRSTAELIKQRYEWRGYEANQLKTIGDANAITFCAGQANTILGTITICIDGQNGLLCEETYPDEILVLRDSGERLCELTKFAVDQTCLSRQVMGALFHVSYIYAHRFHNISTLVIEVNPRHVMFYCKSLRFKQVGERKHCRRAGADAVLLRLPLEHVSRQIPMARTIIPTHASRNLYPYFFSKHEESGIASRLARLTGLTEVFTNP